MQKKSSIPGGSEKVAKAGAIFEAKFRRSTQTCCYLRSKKRMNGIDPQLLGKGRAVRKGPRTEDDT